MNTQALFCLSLPLVIAGCAQQTSTQTARDSAFAQSQQPSVFSDIYQRSPEVTRSGRYTLVSIKSADAQREPLNQLIDITMPGQLVNSVGDGFRYLLFQSGYSLCGHYGADFSELLNRPLPAVQRKIGPMRLSEALQVVAGPAWRMSVDEVNREVCFVLRDAYRVQAKTKALTSVTPAVTGAARTSSPETTRNPYTGVLPGNKAEPVIAGQHLAAKKGTELKPVSQSLPVPALRPGGTPVTSGVSSAPPVKQVSSPAPRNPFTGKNLTGTTLRITALTHRWYLKATLRRRWFRCLTFIRKLTSPYLLKLPACSAWFQLRINRLTGRSYGLVHCRSGHSISACRRTCPDHSAKRGCQSAAVGEFVSVGPANVIAGCGN